MSIKNLTRPCLREVSPYFPGKPVAEVKRELGLKKVVKLASNENFLGPSPKALALLKRRIKEVHVYPEGASPLLRRAIAEDSGVEPSQVVVANGSDEVVRLLCEAFLTTEDEVVCSQYAFIRFKQQAQMMGAKVIEVPMTDWRHDLTLMRRAVSSRTKLLFVASPNNPTGTYNTAAEIRDLLDHLPATTVVILDEAYCQYAAGCEDYPQSLPELVAKYPNLIVTRTFSKAYGLAGLRVGYGVGDAELIGWLDRIRMPFNVNMLGQEAALEALQDTAFVKKSVALTARYRESLAAQLRDLGLYSPDSAANFLFVECPIPGRELFRRLLRSGVIIRPIDEYGLSGHVRITVGSEAENKILVAAVKKALAQPVEAVS